MAKYRPTIHSKVRFSQRVDYRERMDETVKAALKFGVRLDDIPKEHERLRCFMQRDKIYYKERIYIFAEQYQYHTLVTVYYNRSKLLEEIFRKKEKRRKEKYYRQMLTTQSNVLYSITLYKERICEFKIIPKKTYSYKILEDRELMIKISKHMAKLIKGKVSQYDVGTYLEELSDLEKKIYKLVTEIPIGQTMTYKDVANKQKISVQKLSRILNKCPIPIFIPTHRVVKSNGQSGTHTISKEFKKELLKREKETMINLNINKKKVKEVEVITNEHLCYSLSVMLKHLI